MPYPPGATIDATFAGAITPDWTYARASTATDGAYTDQPGSTYNTYGVNVPRFALGGLLIEPQARTNYLLNSTAPATQTIASFTATWNLVLWCIGTGSVTVTAGTGAATGLGTATPGVPLNFTVTTTGSFVFTVNGSLDRFQLERGGLPTSFIPTTGVAGVRQAESLFQNLGGWYNPGVGTLVATSIWPMVSALSNNQGVFELSDATVNNRVQVSQNGSAQAISTAATVPQYNANQPGTPFLSGRTYTVAIRFSPADYRGSAGGVLMTSSGAGKAFPTGISRIDVPLGATSNFGCTWILVRGAYYPWAFSDSELVVATAGQGLLNTSIIV